MAGKRIGFWFLLAAVCASTIPGRTEFKLETELPEGKQTVTADTQGEIVLIDLMEAAKRLGVEVRRDEGRVVLDFTDHSMTVDPQKNQCWRRAGRKKSQNIPLEIPPIVRGERVWVGLVDLPRLFERPFTYDRRRKKLLDGNGSVARDEFRAVPVRSVMQGGKRWVALEDVAKELNVVVYSPDARVYNLVMRDFSVWQLRVGEDKAFRRGRVEKVLEEPVLLIAGSPYLSLSSAGTLFEIDTRWNDSKGVLLIPRRPDSLQRSDADPWKLRVIDETPEPIHIELERVSVYYQSPAPSFAAPHDRPYDSMSDWLTREPVDTGKTGLGQWNGEALARLGGKMAGKPLNGNALVDKVGDRTRLVQGTIGWGNPSLRLEAGREYASVGRFSTQFALVDQGAVSSESEAQKVTNVTRWTAAYGQTCFSVFLSTSLFSQTVDYRQQFTHVGYDARGIGPGGQFGASVDQYLFFNRAENVLAHVNNESLWREILGDAFESFIEEPDRNALAQEVLDSRHQTTRLGMDWKMNGHLETSGDVAMSYYRADNDPNRDWVVDNSWRLQAVVRANGSRLDTRYESIGPRYRSLGDPLRYQDRRIFRLSPYLHLARAWKVLGEFRRETYGGRSSQGGPTAYTTDFSSLRNLFHFSRQTFRVSLTKFESTLFGDRWTGGFDTTRAFGRHSVDMGVDWSSQWFQRGDLFRQSYTGRGGFTLLFPSWKVTAGEELTRDHYKTLRQSRWESSSNVLLERNRFSSLVEYRYEPKRIISDETLYTGFLRLGLETRPRHYVRIFFSTTGRHNNLSKPDVWRTGMEYVVGSLN